MLEVRSQTLGAGVELETQVPNWAVFFVFPFNGWQSLREKDRLELGWQGDKVPAHTHLESVFFCRGGQVCRRVFPFQGSLASQVFFSIDKMSKKNDLRSGVGCFGVVVRTFFGAFWNLVFSEFLWFSASSRFRCQSRGFLRPFSPMRHCRKTLCNAVGVLSIGQGLLRSCGESYIAFSFPTFCGFLWFCRRVWGRSSLDSCKRISMRASKGHVATIFTGLHLPMIALAWCEPFMGL